ncbi:L-rhamnose mutarotase [Leifsonia sp. TF02-11]|uniref:L-rhamnose mutarotase n=1 Tax=Leifsonia sp. TF02-11 TaxID=2815212 RepID=UPI001AA0D3DD|nr:L-rhamnose mutarotase [Leifsonia sp. TF02-11]MBO1741561.1 L-rhamnose mutarotase [Leifsonia sp. TF02-11]
MSARIALTLQVPHEALSEYERRHQHIWDELTQAIKDQGGKNYSIFAAPHLDVVFSYVEVDDEAAWRESAASELTHRWWQYMSEIMPTNSDLSPISHELPLIFHQD